MDIASKILNRWSVTTAWLFQISPSKTLTQISKMGKCENCRLSIFIQYFHLKYRGARLLATLIKILTPAVTWASIQYWYSSSSIPLNSANWAMKAVKYKKLAIAVNQNSCKDEMISYNYVCKNDFDNYGTNSMQMKSSVGHLQNYWLNPIKTNQSPPLLKLSSVPLWRQKSIEWRHWLTPLLLAVLGKKVFNFAFVAGFGFVICNMIMYN